MKFLSLLHIIILSPVLISCTTQNPLLSNAGYRINITKSNVTSWKTLNEQHIIMQKYDYSCGAASLATLMKYYFNEDINEQTLLNYIKTVFNKQEYKKIEKDGLSFLELEKISQSRGYQSANVRLKLSALKQLSGPVIVFLKTKNYRHFAVLRGVREDRVFLADPSRGNIRLSIEEFTQEWKGETFVLGKAGFGTPFQHNLAILHQAGFRNEQDILRPVLLDRPQTSVARLE
jgi:predicted double-glycine peptidase